MRIFSTILLVLAISSNAFAGERSKFKIEEHRLLADSVFAAVLREIGVRDTNGWTIHLEEGDVIGLRTALWNHKNFGVLTAHFAEDDMRPERFHSRTQSIMQQLSTLSSDRAEAEWTERSIRADRAAYPSEKNGMNVVANYLLHHLIALHFAQRAGAIMDSPARAREDLLLALSYEAMAQGFLADAFSAGHMLVPRGDKFDSFHPANNRVAHNKYGTGGVYVINSLGSAWKAFGDRLLHWYAPSYNETLSAGITSLKEVFLVYFAGPGSSDVPVALRGWATAVGNDAPVDNLVESWLSWQNGDEYFAQKLLPTLLHLPMPVSATWSIRSDQQDEHGIHARFHTPQLKEVGYHDPDLHKIERGLLYSRESLPDWAIPELLEEGDPEDLIRNHPDVASVRYVQLSLLPAGYEGLQINVGIAYLLGRGDDTAAAQIGIGYAMFNDLRLMRNVAVQARIWLPNGGSRPNVLSTSFSFSIPLADWAPVAAAIPFEIGYAGATNDYPGNGGILLSLGIESSTLPLGFTNAGITAQLVYTYARLNDVVHGPTFRLFLH